MRREVATWFDGLRCDAKQRKDRGEERGERGKVRTRCFGLRERGDRGREEWSGKKRKRRTHNNHPYGERQSESKVGVELGVFGERGGGEGGVLERFGGGGDVLLSER